jgi:hypothetical protein
MALLRLLPYEGQIAPRTLFPVTPSYRSEQPLLTNSDFSMINDQRVERSLLLFQPQSKLTL